MAPSQLTRTGMGLVAMLVAGALGSLLGCEGGTSRGGLVVALESDLASPKDIDRIRFEVLQSGKLVRGQDFALGEGASLLPLEVEVPSRGDDDPVMLQGTAYKGEIARIERHAITQVPAEHFALLRMPFHYLCDGSANRDGSSSCPDGQTCKHGACADAGLDPSQLTRIDGDGTGTRSSPILGDDDAPGAGTCFDVLACFANPVVVELDLGTCSFVVDETVPREAINVALALPPGTDGICDSQGCWVALSPGEDGWTFDRGVIQLPASLCTAVPDADPPAVAVSLACPSKPPSVPPCGPWSSQRDPIPPLPASVLPPDAIGDACGGRATRPCGQCGVSQRMCRNGNWQAWSECTGEGVCEPGSTRACGADGSQVCGDGCEWSECAGQSCTGPQSEACGNCGTRTRQCTNGSWTDWTACSDEGVCAPDQVEACGTGGNHTCTGSCQWGPCTDQSCPGSPTRACAMCGTQSRECDENTGDWSGFGQCDGQGACIPGTTQTCGNGGTRTCGGNCQWGELCSGQSCPGATMEACGNCGIRTRGCDRNTGLPTAWSACTDQGDCAPGTSMLCGTGSRTCSDRCEWSECSGCPDGQLNCAGACVAIASSDANCGACGRTCGDDQSCRNGACVCSLGLLACGDACVDPDTDAANCGRCGVQCGGGQLCRGGNCACPRGTENVRGICLPVCARTEERCGDDDECVDVSSDPAHCGGCNVRCNRRETCEGGDCTAMETPMQIQLPTCDSLCGDSCVDFLTDPAHCGNCDTACTDGQECAEGACRNICGAPRTLCGAECTNLATDRAHCGNCDLACTDGQECSRGACRAVCVDPLTVCGTDCTNLTTDRAHCGSCDLACTDGQECLEGACHDACDDPLVRCGSECTDLRTNPAHCGDCGLACDSGLTCAEGRCGDSRCDAGFSQCPRGCFDLQGDRSNCGACGRACADGDVCRQGGCVKG